MIVHDLPIRGAKIVEIEPIGDERGFFARAWDRDELAVAGIEMTIVQANLSRTASAGTIRGLHHQLAPTEEDKYIRCTRGAAWEVVVDLRPSSPTYRRWHGVELSDENHLALFVPKGCARGFQTLVDDVEVSYSVSAPYTPANEAGIRFDDPAFGIDWPLEVTVVSDKDRSWPNFDGDLRDHHR
ncbi:MAG: dTDP-4-dehydrorhamnose 3,5-epimerase [Acidimicrobiales bacterium]